MRCKDCNEEKGKNGFPTSYIHRDKDDKIGICRVCTKTRGIQNAIIHEKKLESLGVNQSEWATYKRLAKKRGSHLSFIFDLEPTPFPMDQVGDQEWRPSCI